ncbi:hypothetical protein [Mesorhizobium sp. M0643]|uniref:hypothetical protein n=1 Tax=unclassified Mesorhizobium TaxID=325217 RepID=UPI00333A83B6
MERAQALSILTHPFTCSADTLIPSGAGRHWIERYRGDIFVFVSDAADEAILRREFSGLLDAVDDTETDRTGRR